MSIETLLQDEIQNELGELKKISLGTDEYKTTVDGVTKLMDRAIEMRRLNIENNDKAETRDFEADIRMKQMEEEKRDRIIKNCLTAAGIIVPTLLAIWGTKKSFEFEKEGTITTIMGRGFIQKLLPKK